MKEESPLTHSEFEDRQQVIGAPPPMLLNYGLTVIFVFVAILLLLAAVVKFPDKIMTRAMLTTSTPPIRIVSKVDAPIVFLDVQNNSVVKKGQVLGAFVNAANFRDVLLLDSLLNVDIEAKPGTLKGSLTLGSLQTGFSELTSRYNDLESFRKADLHRQKVESIDNQVTQLQALNKIIVKRKEITIERYDIAEKDYSRNKALHETKVISDVDFEKVQTSFLTSSDQLEAINEEILNNSTHITQLLNEKTGLVIDYTEQLRVKTVALEEAIRKMKSEVANWLQYYVIRAPEDGRTSFTTPLVEKQFIRANSELFTIVPDKSNDEIYARSSLKGLGIGKVKVGMKTIIQLDGYPYQEFGSLIGTVSSIGAVPGQDGYVIEIKLDNQMNTTYKRSIPFNQEMQGEANIITENRSILRRIFEKFFSALKNTSV